VWHVATGDPQSFDKLKDDLQVYVPFVYEKKREIWKANARERQ